MNNNAATWSVTSCVSQQAQPNQAETNWVPSSTQHMVIT